MISKGKPGLALIAMALVLVASFGAASAQGRQGGGRRGGFGGRGGGGLGLLRNASVQEELKMTQPQIQKMEAKQQEMRQARQQAFQNGGGQAPGQAQGEADPQARRAMMQKMQEEQQKAIADILDNVQLHRFKQIELQIQGPSALTRKEVQDQLQITDAQKQQIQSIRQEDQTQMRNMRQGVDMRSMSDADRQQFMAKMQAARKASGDKYLGILTAAQKAQWKKLLGAPFKLVLPQRGGAPSASA